MLLTAVTPVYAGDPANPQVAPPQNVRYRPDRILIARRTGIAQGELNAFHHRRAVQLMGRLGPGGQIELLQLPPGRSVPDMVDQYRRSGLVLEAEPDYRLEAAAMPNDPEFTAGYLWGLHNTGQRFGYADVDIDAPEAWDTLCDASGVIVAIIDSGARCTHEDLVDNLWVNPGEIPDNGWDDDGNGVVDDIHGINAGGLVNTGNPFDVTGHGTHVAGIVGATGDNGQGVCGVAWRAQLMICRFMDDTGNGYVSDAIECIDYAIAHGAQVINASWGGSDYSSFLESAVRRARDAGVVLVAAAGNDGVDVGLTPFYPACLSLDNVVSVTATTYTDQLASFANYGADQVDIAAPGSVIRSTYFITDTAYVDMGGTSMAAPFVSGTMALLAARYPEDTYRELIDRLLNTADPIPALEGKCATGGRVNLAAALGPSVAADFQAEPAVGEAPLRVEFTDRSFGAIALWEWDFGDGSGFSYEQHPTHHYTAAGEYEVRLTVTGSSGATNSVSRTVSAVANYEIESAAYAWIDPTGMTPLSLSDNGVSPAQALPFPVRFYGREYSTLYVTANGLIGFDRDGLESAANTSLPSAAIPDAIVAPLWDDLNPGAGGAIYVGTTGAAPDRRLVVSWVDIRHRLLPSNRVTFQTVFEEGASDLLFQYAEVGTSTDYGRGRSATVGVEHPSGLVARLHTYNGSSLLSNGQALRFVASLAPQLCVTPTGDFGPSGPVGGPFSPSQATYTLANTGTSPMTWSARALQGWIDLSGTGGTLAGGETLAVTVCLNDYATAFGPGIYANTIEFVNVTTGVGNTTRPVLLTVEAWPGALGVVQTDWPSPAGFCGGPFQPCVWTCTLTNSGGTSLEWSAMSSTDWMGLSALDGDLAAGEVCALTLSIDSERASLLPVGLHTNVMTFFDATQDTYLTRQTVLEIYPLPWIAMSLAAQDPGWVTLELQGVPEQTAVLEGSEDFEDWAAEQTLVVGPDGRVAFAVNADPLIPHRFYRVVFEP